jgi:sodium transport system ATP-binding protein
LIHADGLSKSFKKVVAVRNVSFQADDGKITALLGPNGAGKSTTLRMLATMVKPDSGRAKIANCDVVEEPMAVRQNIGVLPHDSGLYARLTGIENVRYFGKLQGIGKPDLDKRIEELTERLDMANFCTRRTAGYSQGQRVKVALARALVHDPQHVLLDEPTNGLDVMATRALREIILNLKAQGKCVLFSSHIMQEVENLCDDVVIIGKGEVKFEGSIQGLRDQSGEEHLEEAFVQMAGAGESAESTK